MALTVDDAIATLFTLTQHDEQPGVQGLTSTMVYDASYRTSYTEYAEVAAFQLSLEDDTAAINQLDALLADGKDALASLYTYRSVSKSFPESVQALDENAEPGLLQEAFALVDVEIQRLRDIHQWQMRAQSLIAADLQRFSGEMTGPTLTHLWSLLRVLDTCLLLDLLKHTKAAPLPDLLWFRRAVQSGRVDAAKGSDTDSDLEEFWSKRWAVLSSLQVGIPGNETVEEFFVQLMVVATGTIESGRTLLFADRLMLLRVLPVLISLAARTEAEADMLFRRRVKLDRLLRLFKREPLVAGYKEVPFALASLLPDLSPFFRKLCVEKGVLLPVPSNMDAKEVSRVYDLLPQMPAIAKAHEELCLRFTAAMNKLTVMKHARVKSRSPQAKEVRVEVYRVLLEGLLLLSRWSGRLLQHFAWKTHLAASHAAASPPPPATTSSPAAAAAAAGASGVAGASNAAGVAGGSAAAAVNAEAAARESGSTAADGEPRRLHQLFAEAAGCPPSPSPSPSSRPPVAAGAAGVGGVGPGGGKGKQSLSAYEQMVQHGFSQAELQAVLQLIAYIKGVAAMMTAVEGDIAWVLREAIHADVQEFARVYVASLLKRVSSSNMDSPYARTLLRIRAVAADWAGIPEEEALEVVVKSRKGHPVNEDDLKRLALPRPTPPSLAQIHCLQHLVQALVIGASAGVKGGFFGPEKSKQGGKEEGGKSRSKGRDREVSASEIKELDNFLQRLLFFPHLLDYPNALLQVTDLSFLWLRESFLDPAATTQVPLSASLPWVLTLSALQHTTNCSSSSGDSSSGGSGSSSVTVAPATGGSSSADGGSAAGAGDAAATTATAAPATAGSASGGVTETPWASSLPDAVLLPFTIYDDAADAALRSLKRQFLFDEVEAEVGVAFDQLLEKLSLAIFTHFKQCASSKLLDKSFVAAAAAVGVGGRYSVTPCSYSGLLRQTHLQLLGRTVDMRDLLTQRLNKLTRHNLDYILARMEGADLCHIMETHHLLDVLRGAHRLVAEHCPAIDSFEAIFTEATHSTSLSSLSSRTASYVCREVEQDVLPNFLWNATTRRFVRVASPLHLQQRPVQRPAVHLPSPEVYEAFMFGNKDLNEAYAHIALLHSQFIGQPHVDAVVALLGPHSLPMLLQFCLDSLSHKVSHQLSPLAAQLLPLLPTEDLQSPLESGLPACVERISGAVSALQHREAAAVGGVVATLRDVGSLLGLLALLDVSIAHASTLQFIQAAPWLGLVPSPSHNRLLQLLRVNPSDLPPHEAFTPRGLRHRSPRHRPSHESRRETRGGETARAELESARASADPGGAGDRCDGVVCGNIGALGDGVGDGDWRNNQVEGGSEDRPMGFPPEISLPPAAADGGGGPDAAASAAAAADGSLLELRNLSHEPRHSGAHDKSLHDDPPQSHPPPPPAPPAAPLTDMLQRVCASVPVVRSSMLGMLQAAQVAEAIYWGSVQADSLFAHALSILSTALHPFLPLLAPPVEPWAAKRGNPREFHHLHSLLLALICQRQATSATAAAAATTATASAAAASTAAMGPSPGTHADSHARTPDTIITAPSSPSPHSSAYNTPAHSLSSSSPFTPPTAPLTTTPQSLPITVPHSGPIPSSSPANLPETSSKSGPLSRPSMPGGSAAGHTERAGSTATFPRAGGLVGGRGDEEGDAVVWGGSVVVHLLGQQRRFELDDPCWHAVAVSDYENICWGGEELGGFGAGADVREGGGGGGVMLGVIGSVERQRGKKAAAAAAAREAEARLQQLKAQATAFVENARRLQQVSQQAFILFAAQAPLPPKAARVYGTDGLPTATCFPMPPLGSSAPPASD